MEEVQKRFVLKVTFDGCMNQDLRLRTLQEPDKNFCLRSVHEAYQYLVQRKKKMSGRSMQENWNIGRRKSAGVALLNLGHKEVILKYLLCLSSTYLYIEDKYCS